MRVRGWLGAGVVEDGGWRLPGRPAGHAADLHLAADGVTLRCGGESACLDWPSYRNPGRLWTYDDGDGWWVTRFSHARGSPTGVAIGVGGRVSAQAGSVRRAATTWRNRVLRLDEPGSVVPLLARGHLLRPADAERDTLRALCQCLAERPSWRAGLADPERARRLARALAAGPLPTPTRPLGVKRATVEVLGALDRLGYRHPNGGRPVPGDRLPPVATVVDRILDDIAHNPYALGVSVPRDAVTALVNYHYLDVTPWPFAALSDSWLTVRRRPRSR